MLKYRPEGAIIPSGLSWNWAFGPVIHYMSRQRTWRLRLRLRYADWIGFNPMLQIELVHKDPIKVSRIVEWEWRRAR